MEDLKLFLHSFHTAMIEQLWYKINLFNGAVNGAIVLNSRRQSKMAGGVEQWSIFRRPTGLLTQSTPTGMRPLELKTIINGMANAIRIKWTTESLDLSKYVWNWIGRDPNLAGVVFGRALADETLAAYILRAFTIIKATVGHNPSTTIDVTQETDPAAYTVNLTNMLYTADTLGDASGELRAWIMPSAAKTEMLVDNIKNAAQLFNIGTVNISRDVEGRTFITSDDPSLRDYVTVGGNQRLSWWVFGLVAEAIIIEDLDDYDYTYGEQAGFENILRTYNANWSCKIVVKGYKFDESQLTDANDELGKFAIASLAALNAPENWEMYVDSHKFAAGVALRALSNRPAYAQPQMYNRNPLAQVPA